MAMSMVLPTPIGRGGPHRHGVHRTRSRHHTAHKVGARGTIRESSTGHEAKRLKQCSAAPGSVN